MGRLAWVCRTVWVEGLSEACGWMGRGVCGFFRVERVDGFLVIKGTWVVEGDLVIQVGWVIDGIKAVEKTHSSLIFLKMVSRNEQNKERRYVLHF